MQIYVCEGLIFRYSNHERKKRVPALRFKPSIAEMEVLTLPLCYAPLPQQNYLVKPESVDVPSEPPLVDASLVIQEAEAPNWKQKDGCENVLQIVFRCCKECTKALVASVKAQNYMKLSFEKLCFDALFQPKYLLPVPS